MENYIIFCSYTVKIDLHSFAHNWMLMGISFAKLRNSIYNFYLFLSHINVNCNAYGINAHSFHKYSCSYCAMTTMMSSFACSRSTRIREYNTLKHYKRTNRNRYCASVCVCACESLFVYYMNKNRFCSFNPPLHKSSVCNHGFPIKKKMGVFYYPEP